MASGPLLHWERDNETVYTVDLRLFGLGFL
jgi:hypothetical protein